MLPFVNLNGRQKVFSSGRRIILAQRIRASVAWLACFWFQMVVGGQNWESGTGFRSAAVPVPAKGKAGFVRLPQDLTGITFTNHLSDARAAENQIRLGGSGVA